MFRCSIVFSVRSTLHLRFPAIRNVLLKHFSRIADHRDREKVDHELKDVCMGALAMFCFQDPSLLQFMQRVKASTMAANLRNIWAIDSVPSDTQMRTVMDEIDSIEFERPLHYLLPSPSERQAS